MTTDKQQSELWMEKLAQFKSRFHAILKKDPQRLFFEKEVQVNEDTAASSSQAPSSSSQQQFFEFAGIEFAAQGRRPRSQLNIKKLEDQEAEEWEGTYKQLASIVGQCLWSFRVRGFKMVDKPLQPYLDISRECYPSRGKKWTDLVKLRGYKFQRLKEMYNSCKFREEFTSFNTCREMESAVFMATDAMFKDGITGLGAVWSFPEEENVQDPKVLAWKKVDDRTQIAIEELRTVVLTVEEIIKFCKENKRPVPDVFMLAIDSIHARSLIEKGNARSKVARYLLRKLYHLLDGRRLFMMYVESKLNPSDDPSRGKQVNKELWLKVVKKFRSLYPTAIASSNAAGKNILKL